MSESKKAPIFDHSLELLAPAEKEIYKTVGDTELPLYIFRPKERPDGAKQPIVVFFFSSLWDTGRVSQFAPQCLYLSQRGVIAITADYRVFGRDGSSAIDAMADARDAIRWIRINANALNGNPDWIVAGGGSAGGHLVLSAAMIDDPAFAVPGEDLALGHRPDGVLLFGSVIDPAPLFDATKAFPDLKTARLADATRYVREDLPPMAVFHGVADKILPIATADEFCRRMNKKKNLCHFHPFDGAGSGFFNFNVDDRLYELTLLAVEDFLVELGFLEAFDEADDESPSIEGRLGL